MDVTSRKHRCPFDNINYLCGNAHDMSFIYNILNKESYNVIIDFMVYGTEEFRERADLYLNSCEHYMFLSSARVSADSEIPITEESPLLIDVCKDEDYLKTDDYSLAKGREEKILQSKSKTNWTIIRPYITYSERTLQLGVYGAKDWLYRAMKGRTVVFSDDIASKMTTLTYAKDVARGIIALMLNRNAMGDVFQITCSKSLTWADALDIYLDEVESIIGHRPKVKMEKHSSRLQSSGKYQVKYDRCFNRRFDNSKIKRFVNADDFVLPQEGLRRCVRAYVDSGELLKGGINWGEQAEMDKLTHETAAVNEFEAFKSLRNFKSLIKYYLLRFTNIKIKN